MGGNVLSSCDYSRLKNSADDAGPMHQLTISDALQMSSLPHFLDVLLLPDQQRALGGLEIAYCCLDAGALAGCSRLTNLRQLSLQGAFIGGEVLTEAVRPLLQHATQLTELEISNDNDSENDVPNILPALPSSLVQCGSLQRLSMVGCGLTDLPPGPYLTGKLCWPAFFSSAMVATISSPSCFRV